MSDKEVRATVDKTETTMHSMMQDMDGLDYGDDATFVIDEMAIYNYENDEVEHLRGGQHAVIVEVEHNYVLHPEAGDELMGFLTKLRRGLSAEDLAPVLANYQSEMLTVSDARPFE